ncbi:vegetative cell wall protein gp1-like [Manduca sexta]|uniref:vegetative cell wall protein gp1-like n=1 Tax=Manduca sexta TaxID=7130 RepID=UPI00188FDC52|nr:vegetative cell wall protein gp1-like [Manduca sexta]
MAEPRPMDTDEPAVEVGKTKNALLTTIAEYIKSDPMFCSLVHSLVVANAPRAVPDSPESPASPASSATSTDSSESSSSSDSSESAESSDGPSPPGSPAGAVDPDLAMDSDPGAPSFPLAASSELDDDGFTTVRNGRRKKQRGSEAPASQAPSAPSAPSAQKLKPAASQPAPASSTDSSPPTNLKGPKSHRRTNQAPKAKAPQAEKFVLAPAPTRNPWFPATVRADSRPQAQGGGSPGGSPATPATIPAAAATVPAPVPTPSTSKATSSKVVKSKAPAPSKPQVAATPASSGAASSFSGFPRDYRTPRADPRLLVQNEGTGPL